MSFGFKCVVSNIGKRAEELKGGRWDVGLSFRLGRYLWLTLDKKSDILTFKC